MAALLSRRLPLLLCLVAIAAVALWFRVATLGVKPFWLDEAYSAYAADKGFAFIFTVLPHYETHPPFFSAVLSAWTHVAGNSLIAFRTLGLVAGLALFPLAWRSVTEASHALGGEPRVGGLAAVALLAVAPAIVYITQLVRPYALMALAYLFGIWALLGLARHYRETQTLHARAWYAYLISLALMVWLHNLGALYAASLGLALLILIGPQTLLRDQARRFWIGHVAVALVVLPALLILRDQAPTWQQSTWLRFRWDGIEQHLYTIYGFSGLVAVMLACAVIGLAIAQSARSGRRLWLALILLTVLPTILSLVISVTVAPVFLARTLAPLSIALVVLIGAAVSVPSLVGRAAFAALLLLTTMHMAALQRIGPTENWYGAVAWLKARVAPGDVIYAYPNEGALPLHYALRDKGLSYPIRTIPGPVPAREPGGWFPTGSRGVVSLPRERLEAIAADPQSRAARTVWLLRLGAATYDRGDHFLKALERTRTRVGIWSESPIEIIGLRLPQSAPPEQPQP